MHFTGGPAQGFELPGVLAAIGAIFQVQADALMVGLGQFPVEISRKLRLNLLVHDYKYLSNFLRKRSRASCSREVTVVAGTPRVWASSA